MTDIEIHGVMKCIKTIPLKKLQALEKYTESNLRNIQKELERRKTISQERVEEREKRTPKRG